MKAPVGLGGSYGSHTHFKAVMLDERHATQLASIQHHDDPAVAAADAATHRDHFRAGQCVIYGAEACSGSNPTGTLVAWVRINLHDGCLEGAYTLPAYQGRGAIKFLLELWKQHHPGAKLWLKVAKSNAAGIAVWRQLGFTYEKANSRFSLELQQV